MPYITLFSLYTQNHLCNIFGLRGLNIPGAPRDFLKLHIFYKQVIICLASLVVRHWTWYFPYSVNCIPL
jgi:hypothetical protein